MYHITPKLSISLSMIPHTSKAWMMPLACVTYAFVLKFWGTPFSINSPYIWLRKVFLIRQFIESDYIGKLNNSKWIFSPWNNSSCQSCKLLGFIEIKKFLTLSSHPCKRHVSNWDHQQGTTHNTILPSLSQSLLVTSQLSQTHTLDTVDRILVGIVATRKTSQQS